MTTPYYQDESVTLYCGDSLEVLPTLTDQADVLLTDPPYFKVKQDEWDNQWDKEHDFLEWTGKWLDHTKPLLALHASVWVFASPALASSVERLVDDRFKVLNSIRWIKTQGPHLKGRPGGLRRYLPSWVGVVFAEKAETTAHGRIPTIAHYIQRERERAGFTRNDLDVALGYVRRANPARGTEMCRRWEEGGSLPSAETYSRIREALNGRVSNCLMLEYDDLMRPFQLTDRALSMDVWSFPQVQAYAGKHPCEKPQDMLTHMIETSSRPGWTILDPFAGSGSTLLAARNSGRKAIGIEKDEAWCEKIALRLSENTLNLGEAA